MSADDLATPVDAELGLPEAELVAAWAIVRAAALRQQALTVPLDLRGQSTEVDVDLAATPTTSDLIAHCASALAVRRPAGRGPAADPITLAVTEAGAELRHRPGAVDPMQATLLAELAGRAVRELHRAPHSPPSDLDLLSDDDRRQPQRWRQAAHQVVDGPAPERHRAVSEQARQEPTRLAVICGEQRLTYGELDARSNRLAHLLADRGVGADVRVALCLPPGIDLVVGMLAVLKAGGCYLPVDPGFPSARIAFLLDDADVAVVLGDDATPAAATAGRPVVRLGTQQAREQLAAWPETPPADPSDTGRLGYILYTSGSTGEPKGVAVPEAAVGNLLRSVGRYVTLGPGDTALASSAPIFDISTIEIFLPLVNGARVVVATRDQSRSPAEMVRLIDAYDVRFVQATPTAWRPLTDALTAGGRRERLQALTGGEPLTPDLAARMTAVAGQVINGYGPTETTIYSTFARITDPADVTIGGPVDDTTLYVVDARDRLVPAGVPGELLIGGRGVARGYLNRPELTGQLFVPDTWGPATPGGTVYRTGDLVWWAPDGRLRPIGRIDAQLKVRGHRIEPREVEARLDAHPDVTACVVRAREFGPDDTRLVAFVVTRDGRPLSLADLRAWCADTLPEYLVPTVCLTLSELPRTGTGKLDERALPDAARIRAGLTSTPDPEHGRVEPRTAAERAVARIWREALWADELGVHDDFFELGGDSLVATQVTLRLQQEFVLDVPIRAIFQHPTVSELAAALVRARRAGGFEFPARAGAGEGRDG
ncbi:non-ribosomal peptide synthetase [Micromonospora echinofusca]|uniref:non-ribosomal peptide synthetase n=1 Tax=Micromonospora echinofusca TaxID=47858 RepID=UPI000C70076A|nr:non-ribosomal peptide synthetase [Micromonospora sp. MSM11]MCL7458335.1 non-ribosomal peptide synthetase [Micromonospora sp. MSM11]